MNSTHLVLCSFLAVWVTGSVAQTPSHSPRGLSAPLLQFEVTDKSFEDALRELASRARSDVVIGFEPALSEVGIKPPLIHAAVTNGTVDQALAAMCSADRRYTYSEVQPGVVEVRAVQEVVEIQALMNLPVPHLDLRVRDWPFNLFPRVSELVPELGAYLKAKAIEWAKETGRPLPGSPGITMSTGTAPPTISIQLENTTVRGVLDAFAAYTLVHGSKERSTDVYLPPSGWRVEFTRDPRAPTGLGGYVKWSIYP